MKFFLGLSNVEKGLIIFFVLLFNFSSWVYISESLKLDASLPPRDSQRAAYDALCPGFVDRPAVGYEYFWAVNEGLVNVSDFEFVRVNSCITGFS